MARVKPCPTCGSPPTEVIYDVNNVTRFRCATCAVDYVPPVGRGNKIAQKLITALGLVGAAGFALSIAAGAIITFAVLWALVAYLT
jgi:hypothetical protein